MKLFLRILVLANLLSGAAYADCVNVTSRNYQQMSIREAAVALSSCTDGELRDLEIALVKVIKTEADSLRASLLTGRIVDDEKFISLDTNTATHALVQNEISSRPLKNSFGAN